MRGGRTHLPYSNWKKTFVDRGGRMYAWAHPGGSVIYFSTLPNGSVEVLTEMNPSDGDTAGAEAQNLEMLAESVAPRPAHTRSMRVWALMAETLGR